MATTFRELEIWQSAHQLTIRIYEITETFPRSEIFGLTNQFRRAAVSIAANIVEGFKRSSAKERLRFYNIALASLEECRYYSILMNDLKFNSATIEPELEVLSKRLTAYIKMIRKNPIDLFSLFISW